MDRQVVTLLIRTYQHAYLNLITFIGPHQWCIRVSRFHPIGEGWIEGRLYIEIGIGPCYIRPEYVR